MKSNVSISITILTLFFLVSGLLVFSCSKSSPLSTTKPPINVNGTPKPNQEAEVAALWLSDSLVAPDSLYTTILNNLATIRAEYGDSIPQVKEIFFWPPWVPSEVLLEVTEEAKRQIRAGQYHNLDSLNSLLNFASMDTTSLRFSGLISLYFKGRLNPERLAELYLNVPSVVHAYSNGFVGDHRNVYPWISDGVMTYLFREAWGDCMSGCISNLYWYFEASPSGIKYIGAWHPGTEPEPDWWEEAKLGMHNFRGR